MKNIIGIDIGGSSVKIAVGSERMQYPADGSRETLENAVKAVLQRGDISADSLDGIAATGVGSSVLGDRFLDIPVKTFTEFECFGRGGQHLSGLDKALVVSMGTGTAFVRADGGTYVHLGGSGVGGATLCGLSELITGEKSISEITGMIGRGKTSAVDLTVGDIAGGAVGSLSEDVTAANFGKKLLSRDKNDIAAGLANMIFQTAGVMAAFACKDTDLEKAVFVGSMTEIPEGREMLKAVGKLHDMEFIVPDGGAYAGALGAILLYQSE